MLRRRARLPFPSTSMRETDGRSAPPGKRPRARGTPGVRNASPLAPKALTKLLGPTDLDASRHRGLSKSEIAASPPNPPLEERRRCARLWRPARGVLRFAPRSPRQSVVHDLPLENQALGRHSPDRRIRPTGRQGPRRNVDAPRRFAAWTAGPLHRISDAQDPGHRSPPRVWRR